MSSPEPDEVLFAYIAVASYTVSLVLIRVDNGVQRLVYYVSKSLHEAEALSATGKSYSVSGAWHAQIASLFPSASCLTISKRIRWLFLHNSR